MSVGKGIMIGLGIITAFIGWVFTHLILSQFVQTVFDQISVDIKFTNWILIAIFFVVLAIAGGKD